ncbi:Zn-ribbon domain-containing OB-fold protein [Sabulicella glaciei]|uniref:OB-fold domain-containing protein n=1 Tax=Sabulicella glaciei TaxID=2984948 RepID=A0ABT3NSJ6_9PROT|nr:OB-fold domain-containing protein [Roseococcus sp. MDT2-1-1]MCW8085130.1 OB-fold domain-containing protein [Roseococcus sp. MDT2-1-1]
MATMAFDRQPAAPQESPDNKVYFDGCRAGKLILGKCNDTGKLFHYPRHVSPFTLSNNVEFVEAKGTGTIYSWSVARGKEPFCVAYVQLDEGPIMLTNIIECDLDSLKCGQKVKVKFKDTEGAPVPMFVLA